MCKVECCQTGYKAFWSGSLHKWYCATYRSLSCKQLLSALLLGSKRVNMALFRFLLMLQVFMIVSAASDRISIFQRMIFSRSVGNLLPAKVLLQRILPPPPPTFVNTKGDCFQEQVDTFNMSTCDRKKWSSAESCEKSKHIQNVHKNMWMKKLIAKRVLWKK